MTLRVVRPESKQAGEGPPPPVQPERRAALPWLTRRVALYALLAVLVLMGGVTLAFGLHLSKLAGEFELTLDYGSRITHVKGVNVKLTEGVHETTCVLSL